MATAQAGSDRARTKLNPNTTMAKPTIHSGPPSHPRMATGMPAATPANPVMIDSFELASTSSWSSFTVVGTTALLAIPYALPNTSIPSATGKRTRSSRFRIMNSPTRTRDAAITMIIRRRPLAARSSAGPMNGAITANGAIVSTR